MWSKEPVYPIVALPQALEKVTLLVSAFDATEIELTKACTCWGYKPNSRDGVRLAKTLELFGLIRFVDKSKGKRLVVSPLALRDYFADNVSQDQRNRAVRKFALKPAIFQVIWERWAFDLPPERLIELFLESDLGYSAKSTSGIVRDYLATIDFARTCGLQVSAENRGSAWFEGNGDVLEYSYLPPPRNSLPGDDTHTGFELESDVDVDISLEAGITNLEYEFDETDTGITRRDHFTGERLSAKESLPANASAYGVEMLQEIAMFQVSSNRKIYLMADGPLERGDLESLQAQLSLKLEVGEFAKGEES